MAWALLLAALLPSACAKLPETTNPVTWWHDLQGGAIAEQRPPPPGVGMPYPNLGTVPPKPTPPDPATRQRISSALLQDRSNAQYVASLAPIALPPRPPAPPKSAAADPDATTASLDAVEAPPAKTPVPNASPLTAGDATTAAADNAPPPTIPDAPPAPPVFPGIAIGPTTATPLPKAPPAVAVNKLSESARVPVPVPFATGSAVLPPGAIGPLKQLATRRVGAPPGAAIDITGFGDATDTEPQLQTAGITLGLARAHAIAAALIADGVPANVLRIAAQPSGRGGDARLVDPG
jgi:outer membrane protein OmpA-like peptidoglycan-associated protein